MNNDQRRKKNFRTPRRVRNSCPENRQNGANGLNLRIIANSEVIVEINDEKWPKKDNL